MTRLVGVRAVCDGCSSAAAAVFCVAHRSVVCHACNAQQHSPPASAHHQRVDLAATVLALPFCDRCDDAPATTYCETEATTLCDQCDRVLHTSNPVPTHCRTLISKTLRDRPGEFRELARNRTSSGQRPKYAAPPAPTAPRKNHEKTPKKTENNLQNEPVLRPPAHLPPKEKNSQPQAQSPIPSRTQPCQRRRSSKLLAKRKHRRSSQRASKPTPVSRFPAETPSPGNGSSDILQSGEYPGFLFTPAHASGSYSAFPADNTYTAAPNDPLMGDQNPSFQALQDRQYPSDSSPLGEMSMFTYGSILSGETALDGLNGSGKDSSGSGGSSRRKTPDFEILRRQAIKPPPNTPQTPQAPNVTVTAAPNVAVVAAAAAAAAGEMFLLNSVSSGSGSSGEQRITPPLNDVSRVPDPAGVAEAATAAAESAVAAVDPGRTVTASQAIPSTKPPRLVASIDMEIVDSACDRPERSQQTVRRVDDALLGGTGGPGKPTQLHTQAAQRKRLDEAVRRLDMDNGSSRIARSLTRVENGFRRIQEPLTSVEPNSDVLGHMTDDGEAQVLQSGSDVMGDLEMGPGNEFGMFDSIDLSQFDQNSGGGLGYPLSDYRSGLLDSD